MHLSVLSIGRASGLKAKLGLDQLIWVQSTMPVLSRGERSWQGDAASVDGLPDVLQVNTAGDLSDKEWGEALITNLLVNAEEVDLGHQDLGPVDDHVDRDGRDEGVKLISAGGFDRNDPVTVLPLRRAGWVQRPSQEFDRVVKPELAS